MFLRNLFTLAVASTIYGDCARTVENSKDCTQGLSFKGISIFSKTLPPLPCKIIRSLKGLGKESQVIPLIVLNLDTL